MVMHDDLSRQWQNYSGELCLPLLILQCQLFGYSKQWLCDALLGKQKKKHKMFFFEIKNSKIIFTYFFINYISVSDSP